MHVAIRVKLPSSRTETMNYSVRAWVVAMLVCLVASNVFICDVNAAGECGKTPIRSAAASLSPCLSAAGNARAAVPPSCCSKVGSLIKTAPKCLCAVLLSPLAKQAGIKPGIAITIPKRCNIRNRPAGKKCGSKFQPLQFASNSFFFVFCFLFFVRITATNLGNSLTTKRVHTPMMKVQKSHGREVAEIVLIRALPF
ncbi:hypothetical protein DKX38_013024 [Salix brachista]|uniref:Bifunctional inhibitor/plant lipid transfer protein/seed storage helical domain-containing protein n=1 Tax=Salix brachista TaxID=2182728 RepID=A0A5N5LQT9_9ROSI|nr:hypothetical protein DKX38_013024 [Salix brachista]